MTITKPTVGGSANTWGTILNAALDNLQIQISDIGISVKSKGAFGNAIADDTAAIQSAIDDASAAGGGLVLLPTGTYRITAALTLPSSVGLVGAGRTASVIKGALSTALIKSPNTATRYYDWVLRNFGVDNTTRATVGGIGVDMTNISHARVDNVNSTNVATGLVVNEAAYYNELSTFQVNGATLAVKIGGGATSTNECLFNNLRVNDVANGVTINNSTNMTFVKPSIEAYTGIGIDIAPTSATQYVNLIAPRFENSGGVGVGYRNRALAQATTVVGGMAAGVATPHINDAAAKELTIVAPGVSSPRLDGDQLALYSGGSLNALVYSSGSTVYFRNNVDSAYLNVDALNVTARGFLTAFSTFSQVLALATTNAWNTSVTGDAQNRFMVDTSGKMLWGSGAVAGDTNLYRSAADTLKTDDALTVVGNLTAPKVLFNTLGQIYVSGTTAYFRNAADSGYIGIDVNNLSVRGILSAASSMTMGPYALGTSNTINSSVTGDTQNRFMLDASGKMLWGSGAAGGDTNLYRGAADVLRTDDTFRCGTFTTAGRPTAAAAGIGGQIYDTTLSKPIWSDGTTWRDAAGTAV